MQKLIVSRKARRELQQRMLPLPRLLGHLGQLVRPRIHTPIMDTLPLLVLNTRHTPIHLIPPSLVLHSIDHLSSSIKQPRNSTTRNRRQRMGKVTNSRTASNTLSSLKERIVGVELPLHRVNRTNHIDHPNSIHLIRNSRTILSSNKTSLSPRSAHRLVQAPQ